MRSLRRALRVALPGLGAFLVILAIVLPLPVWVALLLGLGGVGLVQAGARRLADVVLPDERRFHGLRREAERFLALIRQLNTAAVELQDRESDGARLAVDEIERQLHESVDAMLRVAGRPVRVVPSRPEGADAGSPAASGGEGPASSPADDAGRQVAP